MKITRLLNFLKHRVLHESRYVESASEEPGLSPRVRPVEEGGHFATKSKSTVWPIGPQHHVIKKLPGFPTHIGSPPPML